MDALFDVLIHSPSARQTEALTEYDALQARVADNEIQINRMAETIRDRNARVAELEAADRDNTALLSRSHDESMALMVRVAELEAAQECHLHPDAEIQCEVCHEQEVEALKSVLSRVRCCEDACCPQCAAEIAALNIPLP
jgi:chromosome segregation ATPase